MLSNFVTAGAAKVFDPGAGALVLLDVVLLVLVLLVLVLLVLVLLAVVLLVVVLLIVVLLIMVLLIVVLLALQLHSEVAELTATVRYILGRQFSPGKKFSGG